MFTIAVVGKPNVGKSTFINKICKNKLSITFKEPGVTRDILEYRLTIDGNDIRIIDSPGIESIIEKSNIEQEMQKQGMLAIEIADICIIMTDGSSNVDDRDLFVSKLIKKKSKHCKTILAINKFDLFDIENIDSDALSFIDADYTVFLSSEHNIGIDEIKKIISQEISNLPQNTNEIESSPFDLSLAIVGQQNVGKSTIMNKILKHGRSIISEVPGTTRDPVSSRIVFNNRNIKMVDTAGLKEKLYGNSVVDKNSFALTYKSIDFCNIAILVIDASKDFFSFDGKLAQRIIQEGRILMIVLNKTDLVKAKGGLEKRVDYFRSKIGLFAKQNYGKNFIVISMSALNEKNIDSILQTALDLYDLWNLNINTGDINKWIAKMKEDGKSYNVKNGKLKIKFGRQTSSRPISILLHANFSDVPDSAVSNIREHFRSYFNVYNVPIRFTFKKSGNPFTNTESKSSRKYR